MDYNGNGYMNLTEIENGWKYFDKDLPEIMKRDSVINRAFMAAKDKVKGKKSHDADMVKYFGGEFRFLLEYICNFY